MARAFKPHTIKISAETMHTRGTEPSWEGITVTDANRNTHLIKALNWYNYACDSKDARAFYSDWIQLHRTATAADDLRVLARASDRHLNTTMSFLARLQVQGFPVRELDQIRIWEHITAAAARRVEVVEDVPTAAAVPAAERIGVQERIDQQVSQAVADMEDIVSELLRGTRTSAKPTNIAGFSKFSAVHFTRLGDAVSRSASELWELRDARASRDPSDHTQQLLEGYRYVSGKNLKVALAFIDECLSSAGRMAIERKVARVRKAKPVDRARLVRKLKHLPQHQELKLTSIKPVDVLGASEVWVYDVRKRKLGVYRGEFPNSIMVKGTSMIGVMSKSCVQKTLRKPDAQLAEFMKLGKNQLRKWFDAVKSVETELKVRTNEHTILLRVA